MTDVVNVESDVADGAGRVATRVAPASNQWPNEIERPLESDKARRADALVEPEQAAEAHDPDELAERACWLGTEPSTSGATPPSNPLDSAESASAVSSTIATEADKAAAAPRQQPVDTARLRATISVTAAG